MKTLVLGASGQLGQCLRKVSEIRKINDFVFPDERRADILDDDLLKSLFLEEKPDFVINCAAYTAVDKAEDDIDLCRKINKDGAVNVAKLCEIYGATLIHVSTDFVFEGSGHSLLKEDDIAKPVNVYGLTKLEGEKELIGILPTHFILRTSWLYSEYGHNFVKAMLKLGAERGELNVIADQIGTPTYAIDLAGAIIDIVGSGKKDYGIYHYSNEGVASWYDFAIGVFDFSETAVKVNPISTSQYPTRAVRPKFSVLDKTKIKKTFDIEIPYWRDSLQRCIQEIMK